MFYSNKIIRRNLIFSLHLIIFTAMFGSLLAGQNGGKIVNTFPKMGDIWYPTWLHYDPKLNTLRNNLENTFLVHFNHRVLATFTLSTILCKLKNINYRPIIQNMQFRLFTKRSNERIYFS